MQEITNKKDVAKFLGINENDRLFFYKIDNNNWTYEDEEGYEHLFRRSNNKWIELTENVKAKSVRCFSDNDWYYIDQEGFEHLFKKINGKYIELTKGIEAVHVWFYPNEDWAYYNTKGEWHIFNKENKLIRKCKSLWG